MKAIKVEGFKKRTPKKRGAKNPRTGKRVMKEPLKYIDRVLAQEIVDGSR